MDVLSDVIGAVRTGRPFANREQRTGPWRIAYDAVPGIGFHLVLAGSCRLSVGSAGPDLAPVVLRAGDVVLTPRGDAHALTDDGAGLDESVDLLCGAYELDRSHPHPLLTELPHVMVLTAPPDRHPSVARVIGALSDEVTSAELGGDAAVTALLDLMLLFLLREWLTGQAGLESSRWSSALADRVVGTALRCIHDDPSRAWTVESLGARAGLSRAAFSRRFTSMVGRSPMAYLTWWRLTTAARLLRETDLSLQAIAPRCGYGSPFAFAAAFKREHGESPGRYRAARRVGVGSSETIA